MKKNENLGCMQLEGFLSREEVSLDKLKMSFVGGGQTGGKISSEFVRIGYYSNMYNTCAEDITGTENVLSKLSTIEKGKNYTTIRLKGYDGASKDRDLGLKAIKDNKDLIMENLIKDKNLINSDFVWLVGALGGGTYNGSLKTVAQILSGVMRKDKRYKNKPTVGLICAIPEGFSKHKIKINAAQALNEIKELHSQKLIGATLLVDNQKLIDDFLQKDNTHNRDWTTYGNTTVAQLITELASVICLPGRETFDKSELLDILSTPGFFTIGKKHLLSGWKKGKNGEDDKEAVKKLVVDNFENQNVFADGFDYKKALHGGLAVVAPLNSDILSVKDTILLKQELNNYLDSPEVEVTHFGIFENEVFGSYNKPIRSKNEAIIYTLAITKDLPERILTMTKEALEVEEQKRQNSKNDNNELNSLLNSLAATEEEVSVSLDLSDIWAEDSNSKSEKDEASASKDPFDGLFQ